MGRRRLQLVVGEGWLPAAASWGEGGDCYWNGVVVRGWTLVDAGGNGVGFFFIFILSNNELNYYLL